MTFARMTVFVSGVLFVLVGLMFLIDPVRWAAVVDIALTSSLAKTDIRALYGGLDLGIGCLLLYLAWKPDTVAFGLKVVVAVFGGLVIGRIWGLVVDGPSGDMTTLLLLIELAGALVGNIALWRVKSISCVWYY